MELQMSESGDPTSRSTAAQKAWATRRSAVYRARRTEAASKEALRRYCRSHGWKITFFEGASGAPRTGIVDAVMIRITPGSADNVEVKLVQLKGGTGGLKPAEIRRLKSAAETLDSSWTVAAFDGEDIHFLSEEQ
jgi:hypothetical protein